MKLNGIKKNNLRKKLGEVCVYCGCKNKLILTIDHKTHLARGGVDNEKNKQVCCFICNQFKGVLTHEEFKKYNKDIYQAYVDRKHRMLGILKGNELKLFDLFNK